MSLLKNSIRMKVAILLATYNGEKYLRAQLDSLYAQSYRDWKLYVNDDGSTDGTLTILQEYAQRYGNIDLQVNEHSLRSLRNFMDLLRRAEADYYIFSDQDDVWMPEKVEKSPESIPHFCNPSIIWLFIFSLRVAP